MLRQTRGVTLGGVVGIGAGAPISVQSMLKGKLASYDADRLRFLYNSGCDVMRFSIADETEDDIGRFVRRCPFPLVADIQGSSAQALMALRAGCAAVRINPANFSKDKLGEILSVAAEHSAAIRIGVNEGSLGGRDAISLIGEHVGFFESHGFFDIVLSVKSSNAERCAELNRKCASLFGYPIHLGLTEAGPVGVSAVRSTVFMAALLSDGIGDTVRYSVAGSEELEIECGVELLASLGLSRRRFSLVACPMCSRHGIETDEFSGKVKRMIFSHFDIRGLSLSVAVMGCPVNGRGEAANADVAVCAVGNVCEVYEKGRLSAKVSVAELEDALCETIAKRAFSAASAVAT